MFMHTEKELSAEYGWSIADLRDVRALHCKFDGRELWFRKPSKKPEHLRTIIWTDLGVEFLQQWFKGLKEADKILAYLGNDPEGSGRLEELAVTNTVQDLYGLEWEGKVVSNWYPNSRLIEVEHENGIKVIAICRDNKKYRVKDKVLVDSKQASHYVRGLPLKK